MKLRSTSGNMYISTSPGPFCVRYLYFPLIQFFGFRSDAWQPQDSFQRLIGGDVYCKHAVSFPSAWVSWRSLFCLRPSRLPRFNQQSSVLRGTGCALALDVEQRRSVKKKTECSGVSVGICEPGHSSYKNCPHE
jgi:hypothetical protein